MITPGSITMNISWFNKIGRQMLKEVLNYHIYALMLQSLIYINREFLES